MFVLVDIETEWFNSIVIVFSSQMAIIPDVTYLGEARCLHLQGW
jgi:hypothetical protein